ncbi:ABC transporter substrate-binding protein [Streptomyces alkaliterrae]|uniref:ABC transporter substrate-binding protein n=1 Tax=Streptomyces alkaliterrae TaxID=2213162 RepID=A0A5P0YN42_9ACTN|nr:ABC transporter substrate-binding protein [Streptomyces alkaliterrae]MBB1260477.1 ABC transporter substrate-binding protein [Streptomyces alkaliterrae]MQS01681.1 ABC transporter substrate-binding protein [Streptomyces alkaliterrae]
MTARRRTPASPNASRASNDPRASTTPSPRRLPRVAALGTALAMAGTALLTGCGGLPGLGGGASGEPITVMTWAPVKTQATNMPGMPALAKTYARWVNANGGIGGRKLRVITCNEGNDSVRAAACAKRARDEGALAVVGSYSQHGHSFMPHLESVGIPYLGGYGNSAEEFTSPLSYPVNGGQAALVAGNGRQLAERCEKVSLVRPDTIAGDELPGLFNAGLAAGKRDRATDVRAPEDSAHYAAEAERALTAAGAKKVDTQPGGESGIVGAAGPAEAPGSCVSAALGGRTSTFFDSFFRQQREHGRVEIGSVLGSVEQSLVNRTGGGKGPLEGANVTSWYPAGGDPVWDQMKDVVREYAFGDNRIDTYDPGVQTTWVAYTVLHRVLEALDGGKISRQAIQRQLDVGEPVSTGGITPPLGWRYEDQLGTRSYPRLVNPMVNFQRVEKGRLVAAQPDPVNIAATLESAGGR